MLKHALLMSVGLMLIACKAETSTAAPEKSAPAKGATQVKKLAKSAANKVQMEKILPEDFGNGVYMLVAGGGNVGLLVGPDGAFLIDDKYERFSDQLIRVVKQLTDEPIKYVINTHYHGDHTGSNGVMNNLGAEIIAHENVKTRMSQNIDNQLFGGTVEARPEGHWPTQLLSGDASYKLNGQTIQIIHVPRGHTDGDSIIYFEEADVLHMGDNYFNGMFPYVDIDAGGSLQGMIAAQTKAIDMITDKTQIMPGHGRPASKTDLAKSRDMLVDILGRTQAEIDNGKSLQDILDAKILNDLGDYARFIDEDKMVRIAHRSIKGD